MVNSISVIVQNLIDQDLSLQDALQRDYANYSAIARLLKSKVGEAFGQEVKLVSVITAVKRAKLLYRPKKKETSKVVANSIINIRTDAAKITIRKTAKTLKTIRQNLLDFIGEFFYVLEGVSITTLLFDERQFKKINTLFLENEILDKRRNLAAIIIQSPEEIVDTPGCITSFYNQISRRQINIEEAVSCYTDTIIILNMNDVNPAFMALTDLISEARAHIRA
jgi:hypothetical protein